MAKKISDLTAATTPLAGTELVEIVQSGTSKKVAASYLAGSGGAREILSSNRTYYVRTDGSNSNNGLANTSGGAFLTIQKAFDVISSALDLGAGVVVTIQVADGTYTTPVVTNNIVGAGSVTLKGNNSTPANVLISTTSAAGIKHESSNFTLLVQDLKITTTTSGDCIYVTGLLQFQNLNFGSSAGSHIVCASGGNVACSGNYSISGGASGHLVVYGGYVGGFTKTVTLTGTPAFAAGFVYMGIAGRIQYYSITFSGSATGTRYVVNENSVCATNGGGASYFPGNAAGTTATGGQYI